jgi:hypothetical protein
MKATNGRLVILEFVTIPKTSWQIKKDIADRKGISGLDHDNVKKILDELASEGRIIKRNEILSDGKEGDLYSYY